MPGTRGSNRSNPGHFKNIITRGWTWEEGLDSLERVAAHDAVALELGVDVEAPDVGHGVSHATEPSRPCVVVNGATAVQTGARLSISGSDRLNSKTGLFDFNGESTQEFTRQEFAYKR